MRVRCFLLEPTGEEQTSADGHITSPLYRRVDTGEIMTLADAPVGAIARAPWASWCRSQDDGAPLIVKLPDGGLWYVDGPASNCTLPDDITQERHHCWVRHGTAPDITVDKNGPTCSAGGGSIASSHYHGFLRNGWLED